MASSAAAAPQPRGPLSRIVDTLRIDNRSLLLETLRRDPRAVGGDDGRPIGGADSAAGRPEDGGGGPGPGGAGGPSPAAASPPVVDQELVFGSADLRRVLLRQVMAPRGDDAADGSNRKKKKGNKKSNPTQAQEEEEVVRDFNEELGAGGGGGHRATRIAGTSVLSPAVDGSVVSPDGGGGGGRAPFSQTNPFDDDDEDGGAAHAPVTTYVLRGGGFDLPSLAAAAAHRRRALSSEGGRLASVPPGRPPERAFRFLLVPRMTEMERAFLKELGVTDDSERPLGNAAGGATNSLESLPIDLVPLDDDVLSLELTGGSSALPASVVNESDRSGGVSAVAAAAPASAACMRHADIEGCESDVADIVARSLLKLQLLNRGGAGDDSYPLKGAIERVQGLGPLAAAVIDRMMTLRLEEERMDAEAEEEEEEGGDDEDEAMMDSKVDQDEVVNAADGVEITSGVDWQKDKEHKSGEDYNNEPATRQPPIQALLVIDRKIDLVTPMLTPLTYEGLIDDVLQIRVGGCVSVNKSIVEPDDGSEEDRRPRHLSRPRSAAADDPAVLVPLDDSDPLYAEVRDKHVEVFGSFLQNQAKALKESHSQFTNRETARDLTEIHQFVKQIPVFTRNLRSLTNHIHIAELVKSAAEATSFRQRWQTERSMLESEPCYEALEDLVAMGEPPYRWLRLLCLQSLTSNGIKAARYDALRREAVQTYGYEFLAVLSDLEKAGFLRKRETFFMDSMQTPHSTLRKALGLIVPDVDPSRPEDAAYVSSGYAPATVRWVQAAMRGFAGLDEALRELPGGGGRLVDVEQVHPPEGLAEASKRRRGPSLGALAKRWAERAGTGGGHGGGADGATLAREKPVLLVYYVGGVTFMELAALRFLSRRPSFPYSVVCCTTEIVNGGTLLRSLSC